MIIKKKKILLIILILFLSFITFILYLSTPINTFDNKKVEVEIKSGTSTKEIGNILKSKNLIRSTTLFHIYIKLYNIKSLKADTYLMKKNMSLLKIIRFLEKGSNYNPNMIKITFNEGLRISDYISIIEKNTNHTKEEILSVFNDKIYLQTLINKYWFLTDEILNPNIYYSLEGYLAPDTYHFDNKDVEVKEIINTMLNKMNNNLEKYKDIENVHEIFTMASIVELEGTNLENRKMIVGVFNNRLKNGMNMGSDVTTYYGLEKAMTSDLTTDEFASTNPYNTRSVLMVGKMPVGPICSFSMTSLEASINPTESNYFFFVADKHGKIYYTKTNLEHDKKVKEIKEAGDWIW